MLNKILLSSNTFSNNVNSQKQTPKLRFKNNLMTDTVSFGISARTITNNFDSIIDPFADFIVKKGVKGRYLQGKNVTTSGNIQSIHAEQSIIVKEGGYTDTAIVEKKVISSNQPTTITVEKGGIVDIATAQVIKNHGTIRNPIPDR